MNALEPMLRPSVKIDEELIELGSHVATFGKQSLLPLSAVSASEQTVAALMAPGQMAVGAVRAGRALPVPEQA